MKFEMKLSSILLLFIIVGCVAGPPRYLSDEEVTWIAIDNLDPQSAREQVVRSIEEERYSCKTTRYRNDHLFKCGKGQTINYMRQVKGRCLVAPDVSANSICEIHVLQIDRINRDGSVYSQPKPVRDAIDAKIIANTGAKRIMRPIKSNSRFREDRGTPITSESIL